MKFSITTEINVKSFNDLDETMFARIIESADDAMLCKIEDWLYTEFPPIGDKIADNVYRRRVVLNEQFKDDVKHTEKHAVWVSKQTFIG